MKRVLIVEDHFLTTTGIRILLNDILENVEIYESISFEGALETCGVHTLDLIILDIDIPGGTGADMITQFRSIQPEVKILVCTGFDEKKYALDYMPRELRVLHRSRQKDQKCVLQSKRCSKTNDM